MTTDNQSLLRGWLARLTLDPLDLNDPRYVPLQEAGRGAIDDIFSLIDLATAPSTTTQLLSGPSGSGKTTELNRLKGKLEDAGFTVVLIDIIRFVNQSSEIDPTEFLIALGLACGEQLLTDPKAEEQRGFATRLRDFLRRTKVSIDVGPLSASASAEQIKASAPGLSLEIDLKRALKHSEPFVAELRRKLTFLLGQLHAEIMSFFEDLIDGDKEHNPNSRGVVMIVDSLEKLRGTTQNDQQVQASVQGLFAHHSDKLRFRSHHMVYTVPPYLYTASGALPYDGPVNPVPIPQVRNRLGKRDEKTDTVMGEMVEVVKRRIPWEQLLEDKSLLEDVILKSGGHLRDLFRILQQIITLVYGQGLELPVGQQRVDEALAKVARGFSNVTHESAEFMRRVHRQSGEIKPRANEVQLLASLMHTHMLLNHQNDHDWYEVHPLARRTLGLE